MKRNRPAADVLGQEASCCVSGSRPDPRLLAGAVGECRALRDAYFYPGHGGIVTRLPDWTAAGLRQALVSEKIVIRDASNFRGLDQRYFRIAVRRREENERLLAALRRCLA